MAGNFNPNRGTFRGKGGANAPRRHAEDDDQANSRQKMYVANNGPPIVRTDRSVIQYQPKVKVNTDSGWGGRGRGRGGGPMGGGSGGHGVHNPPAGPRSEWRRDPPTGPSHSRQPEASSSYRAPPISPRVNRAYSPSHPVKTSWRPDGRETMDRRSLSPPRRRSHSPIIIDTSPQPTKTLPPPPKTLPQPPKTLPQPLKTLPQPSKNLLPPPKTVVPPSKTVLPDMENTQSLPAKTATTSDQTTATETIVKIEPSAAPTKTTFKVKQPKRPRSPTSPSTPLLPKVTNPHPSSSCSDTTSNPLIDIKPSIADLEDDPPVPPIDDLTRPFGCYSCAIGSMPADTLIKDQPEVRKAARQRFRGEIVARLREQGRKVYGTLWRDDGVAFDWHLIGFDTKLVPGHKDEIAAASGVGAAAKRAARAGQLGGDGVSVGSVGGQGAAEIAGERGDGDVTEQGIHESGGPMEDPPSKKARKEINETPLAAPAPATLKKPKKAPKPNSASVIKARNEAIGKPPVQRVSQPPPYSAEPAPRSTSYNAQVSAFLGDLDYQTPPPVLHPITSQHPPHPQHPNAPPARNNSSAAPPPPPPPPQALPEEKVIDKTLLDSHYARLRVLLAEIDNWVRMRGEATEGMEDILKMQIKRKEQDIFEVQREIEDERRRLGI